MKNTSVTGNVNTVMFVVWAGSRGRAPMSGSSAEACSGIRTDGPGLSWLRTLRSCPTSQPHSDFILVNLT